MANLATINNNLLADSGIDPLSVVTGSGTANQIAYWSSGSAIGSLTTATYPSLTELSYVKGVTSAIQTQLNAKQATLTLTTTGTSGAATLIGATLNIPDYGGALTGYLPLTGGTLTGSLTLNYSTPTIFLNDTGDAGVEVGIRVNGENFEIYEPEDGNKVWLQIVDDGDSFLYGSKIWTAGNLVNPVTGTGTLNYVPKFTTTGSTIGNSQIFDDSTTVGINTATASNTKLAIRGDWVSGHSTVKVYPVTAFASGGLAGYGIFDSNGTTRKAYIAATNTEFQIIGEASVPLVIYSAGVTALTLSTSQEATFASIVGINGVSEAGWALRVNGNTKTQSASGTTIIQINDTSTGGKTWSLISAGAGNVHSVAAGSFYVRNSTDGSSPFIISGAGDVTFSGSVTASSLIKSGGTSSQYLMADGSVSTLTNPVTGTGASGRVVYWTGSSTVSGEDDFFYDAANNRLRINSNTWQSTGSATKLQVGGVLNESSSAVAQINGFVRIKDQLIIHLDSDITKQSVIQTIDDNVTSVGPSGGSLVVGVNSSIASNYKLQVYGDMLIRNGGDLVITPATSGANATLYNDIGNLIINNTTSVNGSMRLGSTSAPDNTMLQVVGDWVSGHSTIKVQGSTSNQTGIGWYNTSGVRKGVIAYSGSNFYIETQDSSTPIAFAPNGTNAMIIDAATGYIAVGNFTAPVALAIQGNTTDKCSLQLYQTAVGGRDYRISSRSDGTLRITDDTAAATRVSVSSSGYVSIGGTTVTDSHLLNIQGSTASSNIGIVLNKTNATAQIWGITNTGPLAFYNYTGASEAMRLTTDGFFLVGGATSAVGTNYKPPVQVKNISASVGNGYGIINASNQQAGGLTLSSSASNGMSLVADPDNLQPSTAIDFQIDGSTRMTITSSSYVGINNTTIPTVLTVYQSSSSTTTIDSGLTIGNGNGTTGCMAPIRFGTYGDQPGSVNYPKQFIAGWRDVNGGGFGDLILGNYKGSDSGAVASYSDTAMRIKKSGNIMIGTTSIDDIQPTYTDVKLQVQNHIYVGSTPSVPSQGKITINGQAGDWSFIQFRNVNTAKYAMGYRDADGLFHIAPGDALSTNTGINMNSSGYCNIGGSSFNGYLTLQGSHIGGYGLLNLESSNNCLIAMNSSSTYDVRIRYKYQSVDKWYVGMVDNESFKWQNASNATQLSLTQAGTLTAAADVVAYGSPSDASLKENINTLENALEKILKLKGVSYDWKDSTEEYRMVGLRSDIGFIAQQVQEVIPELVRKNDNGLLSLRDRGLTALLVEAIKEQQKQIEELKKQLS